MGFDWRSEWSAFQVALVHETAKRYVEWQRRASEDWDAWDEYGPQDQRALEDEFAELFLVQDEARVELLRTGLTPRLPKGVESASKPTNASASG